MKIHRTKMIVGMACLVLVLSFFLSGCLSSHPFRDDRIIAQPDQELKQKLGEEILRLFIARERMLREIHTLENMVKSPREKCIACHYPQSIGDGSQDTDSGSQDTVRRQAEIP